MTRPDRTTLPANLAPLWKLAANLRWSWHAPSCEPFRRLDEDLWLRTRQDPWLMLAEIPAQRLERMAADADYVADVAAAAENLETYLESRETWFAKEVGEEGLRVAYLSAEFGLVRGLRIYSGGLGVLAGDHLKSASDLGVPLVGIGLFYREGYFSQFIDAAGRQQDVYEAADPGRLPLTEVNDADGRPLHLTVPIEGHNVAVRAWRANVGRVPLYLLDTNVRQNRPEDRHITDRLYGGNIEHRIRQELVLGLGGVHLLEAIGWGNAVLHLNEGHAAFAALERARQAATDGSPAVSRGHTAFADALVRAGRSIVFTTHTPVEAGHDYFPPELVEKQLGPYLWSAGVPLVDLLSVSRRDPTNPVEPLCMTILAMRGSSRRNAVSMLHGEVSRRMWADMWPDRGVEQVPIHSITNGVHLATWVAPPMASLYERHVGEDWTDALDSFHWRGAEDIPDADLWSARRAQRAAMIDVLRHRVFLGRGRSRLLLGEALDPDVLTIVFARRFATYKRATLLLSQPDRLAALVAGDRPVQFVFAGKAHPADEHGKALLRQIVESTERPELQGRFVFLEEYDVELARSLVQGADVWLNVPLRPREASGTSGMKAAANGALNLSIADGWWAEAWRDHNRQSDTVGWIVDAGMVSDEHRNEADAAEVFRILEQEVVTLFHERDAEGRPHGWLSRVRAAMRQLPPFFNTHRMVRDYVLESYLPASSRSVLAPAADAGRK